jgi:hypothetical protein
MDDARRLEPDTPPEHTPTQDALIVPPWQPAHGPQPQVHTYPTDAQPGLWIYADGQWHQARATARLRTHGRTAYQVTLNLSGHGNTIRTYLWGTDATQAR